MKKLKKYWWLFVVVIPTMVAFSSRVQAMWGAPEKIDENWERSQSQWQQMYSAQQEYYNQQQMYQQQQQDYWNRQEQVNSQYFNWLKELERQNRGTV